VLKVSAAWAVIVVAGVGAFAWARTSVDSQRREAMKSRERMKNANSGEYQLTRKFVKDNSVSSSIAASQDDQQGGAVSR